MTAPVDRTAVTRGGSMYPASAAVSGAGFFWGAMGLAPHAASVSAIAASPAHLIG
jgi:hypothetical protein